MERGEWNIGGERRGNKTWSGGGEVERREEREHGEGRRKENKGKNRGKRIFERKEEREHVKGRRKVCMRGWEGGRKENTMEK